MAGHRRRRARASVAALLLSCGLGVSCLRAAGASAQTPEPVVDVYKTLMVVHPSVVDPHLNGGRSHNGTSEAPGGRWSLRGLLEFIATSVLPASKANLYRSLFEQWREVGVAGNGQAIPARDQALVDSVMLDQFSFVDASGQRSFELWKLPFELIAIVYRPDLRAADGSDAGELRFVFQLIGPDGTEEKFTLNVEYKIKTNNFDARTWAHNFNRLSALEIGSEDYLRLLEKLTWWTVTPIGMDLPRLGQVRSNELVFEPDGAWQLRQFGLVRPNWGQGYFIASALENTPLPSFNASQALSELIAANPVLGSPGTAFMSFQLPAAVTHAGFSEVGTLWTLSNGATSTAADNFGLLTCNGCHQDHRSPAERAGREFYHVKPDISPGIDGAPRLSGFLTGPDPDPLKAERRPGELKRRKENLESLLAEPWTPTWLSL